ncbi:MAG TPA: FtsX-like permease family protein [Candidatus Dormibacteraeota bacterium]|nr:FtsX-like permease family protein [Candidatus Dormibacteraeota bacterium]
MEIVRNFYRHKLRSILTISGIVIGVLALTTMGALAENFNALLDGGVQYFGSNVQVGPPVGQAASLLPLTKIDEIRKVSGVAAAFPTYGFSAKPGAVSVVNFGIPDTIIASDPTEAAWGNLKTTYAQGHAIDADSSGEVVLGSTIDKEFNKKIGDNIELPVKPRDATPDFVNHPFKVVGILNVTRTAPDTFAYINITDGQMLLKDSLPFAVRDVIDVTAIAEGIDVYAKSGTPIGELDKIADRINSQVGGVKASKPSDLVNSFKQGGAIFTAITTAAALLALIIGGLSVVNTMFMAVAERVREIGLKKAVGATTLDIMGEFLAEATLIGVIGGLVGYGLGALITIVANASTPPGQSTLFLITPSLTILAIGFATALGAVAGVLPAWRAARLDPVVALRNE